MKTLVIERPNEKQKLFLSNKHKNVGYGGARGGGKSWSIRTKAKLLGLGYPGIRMMIMRRTYPELLQNHIRQLQQELVLTGICTYNKSEKQMRFLNGSTLDFKYAQREDDLDRLQGSEWDVIFIDEATQFSEEELKKITACCRGVNAFPKHVYYTCNPGGIGHGYIKRIFIDRKYNDNEDPDDYDFVQALVTDNTALMEKDPDYIKMLDALPPKIREAWRFGSWDIFEGQFFEDFIDDPKHYADRQYTHVIEPFDIPPSWPIYRSYDFGYAKPFSFGWWAVSEDGVFYRILEWYGCTKIPNEGIKWTPDQQFKHVAEIESQHPYLKGKRIHGVADPAIWNKESGESVADVAAKYHIYFDHGDNERIAGWMQVHYRLQFDDNGYPMLQVFNTCKAFIRTIPLMMYDEHKPEDLDTTLEDHCPDEVRYMCMTHPIKPQIPHKQYIAEDDPLNQRVHKPRVIFVKEH